MRQKTKAVVMILILLASVMFISGCTQQESGVKSTDDVSRVVTNISSGVQNVGSVLEDIDQSLGGT